GTGAQVAATRSVPVSVPVAAKGLPSAAHAARKLPLQHLPAVTQLRMGTEHGGRLVTDVDHAILAACVPPAPILLPGSVLDELPVAGVVCVGDQVAGALPAARVVGGIAPGGTHQLALAAQVFKVNGRSH